MKIVENFLSIQGECPYLVGLPMAFIRLSGCNLNCTPKTSGFTCDTQYHKDGKEMDIEEILSELSFYYPTKNVCITGGNPSIHKDIDKLIKTLRKNDYKVFIEDNGSVKFPNEYKNCYVVCSPKYYFNLKKWMFYGKNKPAHFKFVYTEALETHILEFIKKYKIPKEKISIMPEGATRKEIIEHCDDTILFCHFNDLRYSPREQVMLWDKCRGK